MFVHLVTSLCHVVGLRAERLEKPSVFFGRFARQMYDDALVRASSAATSRPLGSALFVLYTVMPK